MEKIKWIKLGVNILDDEKIIAIEGLPDGNSLCWMWVKLLALAGKQDRNGEITLTNEIPYTEAQLADRFRMPISTVRLGLVTFQQYGMISIIDNVIYTTNWAKYQAPEDIERIREQSRESSRRYRDKKKALAPAPAAPALPAPEPEDAVYRIPLISGEFHSVTQPDIEQYKKLYPGIDVDQQIRNMIGWCDANPKNRKTKTGVKRFINGWLSREQNRAPRQIVSHEEPAFIPPPPANNGLEDWDDWKK